MWKERTSIAMLKYPWRAYNRINDFYTNDKVPFYSILLFKSIISEIDVSKKQASPKGIYNGTSL